MEPRMTRFARLCFVLALIAAAPAVGSAWAQSIERPSPAARQAILGTINAQLDAFQRDDGAGAFSYATPALRQLFGTPENFMAMVRGGYQPVYRPRSVEFLDARIIEGRIGQAVRFVGPDGSAVIALYTMEQQPDGSWRIAAVHLIPSDELSS
ncbi:MAG: DUF4864 domain-containing protein [Kiloniellaceae bacterium]